MRQLVLLSLLFGAACASSNIVLFDSRTGAYLQPGEATLRNGGASVSSVVAAVTGLLPAERVDAGLSAQVNSLMISVVYVLFLENGINNGSPDSGGHALTEVVLVRVFLWPRSWRPL